MRRADKFVEYYVSPACLRSLNRGCCPECGSTLRIKMNKAPSELTDGCEVIFDFECDNCRWDMRSMKGRVSLSRGNLISLSFRVITLG